MSVLELWDSSLPINFLKMGIKSPFLAKFPSIEVSNVWVFPIFAETVDPCLLTISCPPWYHRLGIGGTSNKKLPVIPGGAYIMWSIPCSGAIPARPDYMPRNLDNMCAAACRFRDDSLCSRLHALMRSLTISHKHIRNLRINRRGDNREGMVDQ